ncbi:MAG: tetratricopeptide repeat protein [Acidobacteria bacterium]|nr:tetratricopeptide repeat protein [Acidobacteriota bacterium]
MVLFVHNSTFRHFLFASLLVILFSFSALSQDNPPTLEAALATTEPPARIEALQNFLKAQPDAAQAETARAELTRTFAYLGETNLAEKNVDVAIQNFKRAVASFPQKPDDKFFDEVAIKIPLAVSVRGYRTEAILLAREIEARFAQDAKRLTSLGEFYLSVEAPSEALRALHTAVKIAPDNARIYRTLGAAYRVNLNLEEAAAQYQHAIKADPKDARAYFELGNLHRARGNYELATNLYNHQISLEPEHLPSLKGLALCYIAQDKEAQASEILGQAAKITSTELKQDFYFQTQLAFTYLARGKTGKARLAADTALVAEPRFSWARIAAAEVDLAEGKYFEAERNVIAAMKYADFPSLHFMLGKIYLSVEDFEGALEELNKAFSFKADVFQTRLGGAVDAKAASVAELLAPERRASLFQFEPITNEVEFKLAENLVRFEDAIRSARQSSSALLSAILINQKNNKVAAANLHKLTEDFVETEGSRKPFRWLYAAERLTQSGQGLETALQLTTQALDAAESVTTPEGSLRDYPNYDREGRLRVFRGRTLTLRGRALAKLGRTQEAITTLEQAVDSYGMAPERKRAQWQLALAKESAGQTKEALDLYIVAYEPPDKNSIGSDLNRAVIESLYRKVNGSLDGLNERIGKARETEMLALSGPKQLTPVPTPATTNAPTETATESAAPPATTTESGAKTEAPTEKVPTETSAETAAKAEPNAPIVLPEARMIALLAGEIANTEIRQEAASGIEDIAEALPPSVALTTKTNKPVEATEALVMLPESKPTSLALAAPAPADRVVEIDFAREDAPLPATTTAEVAKVTEGTKTAEPVALIALPAAPSLPQTLLPRLEEASSNIPELAFLISEADDPAPSVVTPNRAETEAVAAPLSKESVDDGPQKTQLSDSRVAEIEKAINRGSSGGKKGDSADAIEESASGHIEGDTIVRPGKPVEPIPLLGESGHITDTTPKANKINDEGNPRSLPVEVEQRAKTIGQSAGKLSVGAAMEIETPEKPAGGGRKGIKPNEQESTPARPRRVKENETPTEEPPRDPKKPHNQ